MGPSRTLVLTSVIVVIITISQISAMNCSDEQSKVYSIPLHKIHRTENHRTKNDAETDFYVEIGIGTPPQILRVAFDTGYAETWVRSSFDKKCSGNRCYDHHKSNSYVQNGTKILITESGSMQGYLSQDVVQIGHNCKINNLTFAEVSKSKTTVLDGVVGLGYRTLSKSMHTSTQVLSTMHGKGLLENKTFAFYYNKSDPNASQITLGGWNKKLIKSEESIHWVNLIEGESWKFKMERLVMGNLTINATAAIADTGSEMILGPRKDIREIAKYFGEQLPTEQHSFTMLSVSKENFKNIPSITFKINGSNHTVHKEDIFIEELKDGRYLLAVGTKGNIDYWVLGDRFLSNYYTIFDMDRRAVGFSSLKGKLSTSANLLTPGAAERSSSGVIVPMLPYATFLPLILNGTTSSTPNGADSSSTNMQDNPKNLERNSTSKIQSILNRLEEGEKQIQYAKDSNIVLVLGNTGAGKSTFVQYIAGNNHNLISEEVDDTGDYRIKDTNNKIGSSLIASHTEIPELVFDVKTNTTFYDCPGFSDTRNAEHDIAGTYFIKKIIDHAKAVKLVFIVNYFSVQPYRDKSDFMLLTNHAISMMKNIDKFKGGIVIVASKVSDVKPDIKIIKTVANFLTKIEAELNNSIYLQQDELKQNKTIKAVQFIDALLTKNSTNSTDYLRIGFIKQPKEPGPLINITEMQDHKKTLEKLLHENIQYIQYDARDFGYTVSADSQIYIGDLLEAIHKNILSCVQNVSSTVEAYYNDLAHNMLDKMHSFVNSTITVKIETNISEAQSFSAQLKNGYKTISKLITEIKNINSTEELAKKINDSIHALDINISQSVVSDILKQGEYLEFFSSISNVKSTEPLKQLELASSIQTAFQTIFESSDFIQGNATAVADQIKNNTRSNILESGIKIQDYFSDKEKTVHDISKLYAELRQGYDVLHKTQDAANEIVTPEACIQKIRDAVNNLNITSTDIFAAQHNLSSTIKYGGYLSFLNQVSTQSLINEFKCTDGLANVIKYLDHSQKWYNFLQNLYNKLSRYEIQSNRTAYDTNNLIMLGNEKKKEVSKTNLEQFLKKLYTQPSSEYNDIVKTITLDESKINALDRVLSFTLKKHTIDNSSCLSNKLVIKGHYVKLSDINHYPCNETKSINIYALDTVFIDTDLDRTGNQTELTIIAPTWDIQGTRKIILDGKSGAAHEPAQAKNGTFPGGKGADGKPGLPGGPGGNFLGIGKTFRNAQYLTISSNGGKASSGQAGGDGADAEKPSIECDSSECLKMTTIFHYSRHDGIGYTPSSNHYTGICNGFYCERRSDYSTGINTHYYNMFSTGGIGGNGGNGANGGNPGYIYIIGLHTTPNIVTHKYPGDKGDGGNGGNGGKNGDILHISYRDTSLITWKENFKQYYTANDTRASSGTPNSNSVGIAIAKEKTEQLSDLALIINYYKQYLRENLSDSIIESCLRKFLCRLEESDSNLTDSIRSQTLI